MIEKFLVLTLVLGMTSLANATLSFTVDEVDVVVDQQITIDILASDGQLANLGIVIVSTGPGVIEGGENLVNSGVPETYFPLDPSAFGLEGDYAIFADLAIPTIPPTLDGTVVEGILFTCTGLGDVVIQILNPDTEFDVLDTLTIHQIPEPMTLAMLGFGGLLLRRRK